MSAITLTPAERKARRSQAHHLDPVVMIGNDGLTAAVQREIDAALAAHGLIKVRFACDDRAARENALNLLADRLGAAPVQHIGKLLVLWRPTADKPPAARPKGEAPRVVKVLAFPKTGRGRPTLKKLRVVGNQRVTAGGSIKRAKPRLISIKKKVAG